MSVRRGRTARLPLARGGRHGRFRAEGTGETVGGRG